jgi:hypothetical protein
MILAWVVVQSDTPPPEMANSIFSNIARIVTPSHVPFVLDGKERGRSGL